MPRTTIDIDPTVLHTLKEIQRREGKALGRLVSELLVGALHRDRSESLAPFVWTVRPMQARVDLQDKEAVRRALEHG